MELPRGPLCSVPQPSSVWEELLQEQYLSRKTTLKHGLRWSLQLFPPDFGRLLPADFAFPSSCLPIWWTFLLEDRSCAFPALLFFPQAAAPSRVSGLSAGTGAELPRTGYFCSTVAACWAPETGCDPGRGDSSSAHPAPPPRAGPGAVLQLCLCSGNYTLRWFLLPLPPISSHKTRANACKLILCRDFIQETPLVLLACLFGVAFFFFLLLLSLES